MEQAFSEQQVSLKGTECRDVAALLLETCAVDVMEVFSPRRFTAKASAFGLRPGMAIDLEEGWDLDREEDRQQAMAYVDMEKPTLLTGSPPCEAF